MAGDCKRTALEVQKVELMPKCPAIDIEFENLSYAVYVRRVGVKQILRNVSGRFQSGQLTAIMGPSGAGKSTLLNVLAGYKASGMTGSIRINGRVRCLSKFLKITRYIMQQDLIQPLLSVAEVMMMAADLKLGQQITLQEKQAIIDDILRLLRIECTQNTVTTQLSGGERKRLSIALELLNNPPVLFLDEPTTGLDDLSCFQCIQLLKRLSEGGRTVICSIHSPSARLFQLFDRVYVLSRGQCAYQGYGPNVIHFLYDLGAVCPNTYNPADFILEVCSGEYGNFEEQMVSRIDNGRNLCGSTKLVPLFDDDNDGHLESTTFDGSSTSTATSSNNFDANSDVYNANCLDGLLENSNGPNWCRQFYILLLRMWLQMWRDKSHLMLKFLLYVFVGIVIGNLYIDMAEDGSKTIFNFGFYFTCVIFFMYVPMMPILLQFPIEMQHIKREHFNNWYSLSSYFCALTVSTIPLQLVLGCLYLTMIYVLSGQPMDWFRIVPFYSICLLTGFASESFGLLISTILNVPNSVFMGPVLAVPLMLLAVYGFGEGYSAIPVLIKIAMHFCYLRYSLEGLTNVMLSGRPKLKCPDDKEFCIFTDPEEFIAIMGMEGGVLWVELVSLLGFLLVMRCASYYMLRQRLSRSKSFATLRTISGFIHSPIKV